MTFIFDNLTHANHVKSMLIDTFSVNIEQIKIHSIAFTRQFPTQVTYKVAKLPCNPAES